MKSKRNVGLWVAIAALAVLAAALALLILPKLSAGKPILVDASGIHVNPVDGMRPDFMMGANVSMLAQIEASGEAVIGLKVQSDGGSWAFLDDLSLTPNK